MKRNLTIFMNKKTLLCVIGVVMACTMLVSCKKNEPAAEITEKTNTEKQETAETITSETDFAEKEKSITESYDETAETITDENEEETIEQIIGLPNPMKEVENSKEFEEKLGIKLSAEEIDKDVKMFTINETLAEAVWHTENVNGEEVEFTLRATKDKEMAPMMHGIYDSDMSEEIVNNVQISEEKEIELHFKEAKTSGYGIYTFMDGDIYYSLVYDKSMSQMALAEILDRVMIAAGINETK